MRRLFPAHAIAWLLTLLAACSSLGAESNDAGDSGPSDAAGTDGADRGEAADAPGVDLADAAGAEISPDTSVAAPDRFQLPAASGSYALDFSIGIDGAGTGRIGDVSIASGSGTVVVDGASLPVAVYEKQAWESFGYNLYQGIAVAADRWVLFWFYCRGGALTDLYFETTAGGAMEWVTGSGACQESTSPSTVSAAFPAIDMAAPGLVTGFSVTGTNISFGGAEPGWVRVAGRELAVYPFDHVDCSQQCGTPGWHELHSLLWDSQQQGLSFAIFYLFLDQRAVTLTYAISLPSLEAPFDTIEFADATWTGP